MGWPHVIENIVEPDITIDKMIIKCDYIGSSNDGDNIVEATQRYPFRTE